MSFFCSLDFRFYHSTCLTIYFCTCFGLVNGVFWDWINEKHWPTSKFFVFKLQVDVTLRFLVRPLTSLISKSASPSLWLDLYRRIYFKNGTNKVNAKRHVRSFGYWQLSYFSKITMKLCCASKDFEPNFRQTKLLWFICGKVVFTEFVEITEFYLSTIITILSQNFRQITFFYGGFLHCTVCRILQKTSTIHWIPKLE